ncbi:MAG: hypothetical protein WAL91_05775, partial [Propionicimonas sp.]
MSDEEHADTESEDPKAADATQVVRMPQSFEFARAVLGTPTNPSWLGWLDRLLAAHYLTVVGALWGLVVACILGGWVVAGLLFLMLEAVVDWLASRASVRETLLLRRLGAADNVRQLIGGVLLVALLARGGDAWLAASAAAAVLLVQMAYLMLRLSTAW